MTTTAPARVVKNETLVAIRSILDDSDSPEDFLAGVDALFADPDRTLPMPGISVAADALSYGKHKLGVDVDNGPIVYEYLGAMDPSNASDPRLWTCLAFTTYRDYMEQRWPLDVESWKNRVLDRWFIEKATRRALVRHGIARLWWVAHLTFDATCEGPLSQNDGDPFAYTKAVLQNEDRVPALFEREAGSLPQVMRAVLEHAAESADFGKDKHIREVMKGLILVYGYRDLAALDSSGIRALIEEFRPQYGEQLPI